MPSMIKSSVMARKYREIESLKKKFLVEFPNDTSLDVMIVRFSALQSPYIGYQWRVRLELPEDYPKGHPTVTFVDRIFHPNICEDTGYVCLNLLNAEWDPKFALGDIFESLLPLLLTNPNPHDPLNGRAARYNLLHASDQYNILVQEEMERYAEHRHRVGGASTSGETSTSAQD